jgi:hypothetical protein
LLRFPLKEQRMATDGENPRAETHSGRLGVRPRELVDALEGCEPVEGAVWAEAIVGVERVFGDERFYLSDELVVATK